MKDQASISPPKPTNPVKMFANEDYLGETQGTEFKRKIMNFVQKFKEFKENTKKKTK